jgi:hypothetical protein
MALQLQLQLQLTLLLQDYLPPVAPCYYFASHMGEYGISTYSR